MIYLLILRHIKKNTIYFYNQKKIYFIQYTKRKISKLFNS